MKRAVLWAAFVAALLAAMFTLLATIFALSEAVSGRLHRGDTLGSTIAAAVFLAVVTAALVGAAWLAEHQARRLGPTSPPPPDHTAWAPPSPGGITGQGYEGPIRAASSPPATWPTPAEPSAGPTRPAGPPTASRRPRRRHTPASHLANAVILAAFTLGCGVASIAIFHDWRQSVATQDNGIRVIAVVVAADEVRHSSRSGSYRTTNLTVLYPTPVDGRTQGLVVAPRDEPQDGVGTMVAVVVDRSDPGHVELAGVAGTSGSEFALFVGLTAVFALLGARAARAYLRHRVTAPVLNDRPST